jgi:ParB-like chromosome segregation protein Spo0J
MAMKKVPIDHINIHDRRFCITYPLDDASLRASIQKVGVIQPILLLGVSPPYLVITGFKRLAIAHQLGLKEIRRHRRTRGPSLRHPRQQSSWPQSRREGTCN